MKTKPRTIAIPENVISEGVADTYRSLVSQAVHAGFHVEHAELGAWLAVMKARDRMDLVPDCPFAFARKTT